MDSSRPGQGAFCLVARRNDSLSAGGRQRFFVSIAVVSLGIATGWALRGAWYIVPFALLELAVLYVALRVIQRHSGDLEIISIDGDRVLVERRVAGRVSRHEFNRYWARLSVNRSDSSGMVELALGSHGRQVSLGEFLTQEERMRLADELRKRLGNF